MKKFVKGLLLLALVLFFCPCITAHAEDGRVISKGVHVGDVDVSGMTVTEATEAINNYVNELSQKEIVLSAGEGKELTITASELGITWSNPGVIEEAYALGHVGNVVQRYKANKDLENQPVVCSLEFGYDEEAIAAIVATCSGEFNQETVNYGLKKTGEGFEITEGQTGYLVDETESSTAIKNYIADGITGDNNVVALSVKADEPLGSAEDLAKVKDVLGTYTTSYKSSGQARSANVANGCSLINGTTVYPGEEFSVLDVITPFSEANGYYLAGSYLNGVVVESFGGGICQVSTTLYNAVLLAELEVTERHCHSMIVNYVSPSADAAIAESGGKNFKFINNTDYPIYIEGYTTSDKHITFNVYGVETRDAGHKVSYESEVIETTPASADKIVTDPSQPVGYVGVQSAHIGYKAQLWKVVTENGTVTSREVVNSSTYQMVPRIITVGTAGADDAMLNQLNTAIATGDLATIKSVAGALAAAKSAEGTDGAQAAQEAAQQAVDAANEQLQQQAEANQDGDGGDG
ncbi:VanW family protein [Butyrivibrio proteoclasticus]|uniref:VanW family protein n=1 Tax=Butyrivibrio proteoclasticus TaxID=43305 RepID=UPI00047D57CA|nr:VanW family protein [Butyrivibrio proteoclasticus]